MRGLPSLQQLNRWRDYWIVRVVVMEKGPAPASNGLPGSSDNTPVVVLIL
jgi:hypothetical protein